MLLITMTEDDGRFGLGECAPLPDLSCDAGQYDNIGKVAKLIEKAVSSDNYVEELRDYPALLFALESAMFDISNSPTLYDTPFARGEVGIPTNGLIWMAPYEEMLEQVKDKLKAGFRCIKFKIGAIDWEQEINLIAFLRSKFRRDKLEIRVDANGAFSPEEAMSNIYFPDEEVTYNDLYFVISK